MTPFPTYIPLSELISWWPEHLFGNPGLSNIAVTGYQLIQSAARATAHLDLG